MPFLYMVSTGVRMLLFFCFILFLNSNEHHLSLLQVDSVNEIFEEKRDKPQINKNEPPMAGGVRWTHSLFQRIKGGMLPLLRMPNLLESEMGLLVRNCTFLFFIFLQHVQELPEV